MDDSDLYLSTGTCFFGPGQLADSSYIPCGNSGLMGPQACCYTGDYCLSSTACWNYNTAVTYIAGCTDSSFSSAKCTAKTDYPDQQYVAMARCEGDDVDIWSGCYHHTDWIEIQKEPDCACNASKPLIRNSNGKSTLDEIGSLPPTPGGTISFNPTAIPAFTYTSARGSGATPEIFPSAASSPTASSAVSGSTSQSISSGAKVGVGVGVGVGVPLIAALVFMAFIIRRKKTLRGKPSGHEKDLGTTPMPHETDPVWYGYKPELAADSVFKAELSGNEPIGHGTYELWELSSHNAVASAK